MGPRGGPRPSVKLDLLINNAGFLIRDNLDEIDPAALKAPFDVNALGPISVTAALRPLLAKVAKVARGQKPHGVHRLSTLPDAAVLTGAAPS